MNAQELYDEIKAALRHFDLSFGDMDQVTVEARENLVVFSYCGRSCSIQVGEKADDSGEGA